MKFTNFKTILFIYKSKKNFFYLFISQSYNNNNYKFKNLKILIYN